MEKTTKIEAVDPIPTAATEPTGATVTPETVVETVDFKAELEASQAREIKLKGERDNYRRGILIAKGKRPNDGSVIVTDRKEIERIVDERVKASAPAFSPLDRLIGQLSSDTDEQKLIRHIYDTRITHTGTDEDALMSDLEEAHLLANKKTVKKTISELRTAAQHRPTAGSGAGASTAPTVQAGDPDFTTSQLEYFAKRGLNPETVRANLHKVPVLR